MKTNKTSHHNQGSNKDFTMEKSGFNKKSSYDHSKAHSKNTSGNSKMNEYGNTQNKTGKNSHSSKNDYQSDEYEKCDENCKLTR